MGCISLLLPYLGVDRLWLTDIEPSALGTGGTGNSSGSGGGMMSRMRRNVQINTSPELWSRVSYDHLEWGSARDVSRYEHSAIDTVIGSDILYNFRVYNQLFDTIQTLCRFYRQQQNTSTGSAGFDSKTGSPASSVRGFEIILAFDERQPEHEQQFIARFRTPNTKSESTSTIATTTTTAAGSGPHATAPTNSAAPVKSEPEDGWRFTIRRVLIPPTARDSGPTAATTAPPITHVISILYHPTLALS